MEPKNAGALLSDIRGPKGKGVRKSLILVEAQGSELSDDVKKEFIESGGIDHLKATGEEEEPQNQEPESQSIDSGKNDKKGKKRQKRGSLISTSRASHFTKKNTSVKEAANATDDILIEGALRKKASGMLKSGKWQERYFTASEKVRLLATNRWGV